MCSFEQLIFLKYVKSKTFSQNQLKLVFYFNVLNFYGLKYHKISIELYFKFFLCFYLAGFLLSTLLHLSLFKDLNFHFFFSAKVSILSAQENTPKVIFFSPFYVTFSKKSKSFPQLHWLEMEPTFEVTLFLHVSFMLVL